MRTETRLARLWIVGLGCVVLASAACSGKKEVGAQHYAASISDDIRVNQVGYLPYATKIASIVNGSSTPVSFTVENVDTGEIWGPANTQVYGSDIASGDSIHKADFSALSAAGNYQVVVEGAGSQPFVIGEEVYATMAKSAMKYFFYNRTMDIDPAYLEDVIPGTATGEDATPGTPAALYHERMASRLGAADADGNGTVPAFLNWTNHKFLAKDYHWDAGDSAIYPENTATFMAILMNMLERYPDELKDFSLGIPESGLAAPSDPSLTIPDLVSEIAYDADTMASLLPDSANAGELPLATHKIALWDMYPYVKSSHTDWGAYTPKRDAYCNYVPQPCVGEECLIPTEYPSTNGTSDPKFIGLFPEPPREPFGDLLPEISAEGDNDCNAASAKRVRALFASKSSTGATYAVARYLAQLARILKPYDETRANAYWEKAKQAYDVAKAQPVRVWVNNGVDLQSAGTQNYSPTNLEIYLNLAKAPEIQQFKDYNGDGVISATTYDSADPDWRAATADWTTPRGSGPYNDPTWEDDQYAAAVELYLTAGSFSDSEQPTYKADLTNNSNYKVVQRFDWAEDATLGSLSLLTKPEALGDEAAVSEMRANLVAYADFIRNVVDNQGYPSAVPMSSSDFQFGWSDTEGAPDDQKLADNVTPSNIADGLPEYRWGSNKDQAYSGIILVHAYEVTGDLEYLKTAYRIFDYLLGNNAINRSYVTGYGKNVFSHVHHRAALYASGNFGAAPPIGWVVGGPMSMPTDCALMDGYDGNENYDSEMATPRLDPYRVDSDGNMLPAPPKAKGIGGLDPATEATDAANGWCSLEVTGDWNAGFAYLAFLLGEKYKTVLSTPPPFCNPNVEFVKNGNVGQSGNLGTGEVCLKATEQVLGFNCSNLQGRTLTLNGQVYTAAQCSSNVTTIPPPWSDGAYYFLVSAGGVEWASMSYWWDPSNPTPTPSDPDALCTPNAQFNNGQSGNLGTGEICIKVTGAINGFNCSNMQGRIVKLNGQQYTAGQCVSNVTSIPAPWSDGAYYFQVTSGEPAWASMAYW